MCEGIFLLTGSKSLNLIVFDSRVPNRKRIIRTRLKRHNFGIFRLVIFARRQALLHLPHQNLLKILSFSGHRILRERIFGCARQKRR